MSLWDCVHIVRLALVLISLLVRGGYEIKATSKLMHQPRFAGAVRHRCKLPFRRQIKRGKSTSNIITGRQLRPMFRNLDHFPARIASA